MQAVYFSDKVMLGEGLTVWELPAPFRSWVHLGQPAKDFCSYAVKCAITSVSASPYAYSKSKNHISLSSQAVSVFKLSMVESATVCHDPNE